MQSLTKTPPHNLEAERYVLGSIFADNSLIGGLTLLPADYFYPAHKIIYVSMQKLYREEFKIDAISVAEKLKKHKFLARIGGTEYLEKLRDAITKVDPKTVGQHTCVIKEKALLRKLIRTGYGVVQEGLDAVKKPEEILQGLKDEAYNIGQYVVDEEFRLGEALIKAWEELEEYAKDPTIRISTGLTDLDKIFGGYKKKRLYMIAGLPNVGKTSFLIEETGNIINQGHKVLYITLEMSNNEILLRILNKLAGIPMEKLENPCTFSAEDWSNLGSAIQVLKNKPLIVNDTAETMAQIIPLVEKYMPDVVVIDFIDNMAFPMGGSASEIARAVIDLKKLAKRLNVAVLVASQVDREREGFSKDAYQLSDLKGSGGKETGSDIVMFLVWPWNDRKGEINPSTGQKWQYPKDARAFWIVVKKNKFGRKGQVLVFFDDQYGCFSNWSGRTDSGA